MSRNCSSSHLLSRNAGTATASSLFSYIHLSRSHSINTPPPPQGLPLVLRPHHTRHNASVDESCVSLDFDRDDEEDEAGASFIAHVAFNELVRIKAVVVNIGRGEEAPRLCRVWVNRPDGIGFDEVGSVKPDQEWELSEAGGGMEGGAIEYPTKLSRFHSVSTLTFHLSKPSGGDRARIFFLGMLGEAKVLKKDATPVLDVPAENAADSPVDSVRAHMGGSHTTVR